MKTRLFLISCFFVMACTSEKFTQENISCCKAKKTGHYTRQADPHSRADQKVRYILAPASTKKWSDWRTDNEGC